MARYVDITLESAYLPRALGSGSGQACMVPRTSITVALDNDGTWRLMPPFPPHWRYMIPDYAGGTYDETTYTRWFVLYARDGVTEVFVLRGVENLKGPAFAYPSGNQYLMQGSWEPTARPVPHTWAGIMVKGSAGLGYQGEGALGAVVSLNDGHGAGFGAYSHRLGVTAGFSGGVAYVLATGFGKPAEFEGFQSDGADWALSIGAKASGLIKGAKLAPLLRQLQRFEGGLDSVDKVIRRLKDHEITKELHTVAKGVYQRILVDDEVKAVTAIDIPLLGAGAEAGLYYSWSTLKLLSQW